MKVLVTGAAGRLGKHVVRVFVEAGEDVIATDQVDDPQALVPVRVVNLLDAGAVASLMPGIDVVIHLGNIPDYANEREIGIYIDNVTMNMNVFQGAVEAKVRQIHFASSIQAFIGGKVVPRSLGIRPGPPYLPLDSEAPANPHNPYGLSKAVGEQMLEYFCKYYPVSGVSLRFPAMFEDQAWLEYRSKPASAFWVELGFAGLRYSDAAKLLLAIVRAELPGHRVYFPVHPKPVGDISVQQVLREHYTHVPLEKPAEQITSLVDISRITAETGWKPVD